MSRAFVKVAILATIGSVFSANFAAAASPGLMLPCNIGEKQGIPVASIANIGAIASIMKKMPESDRRKFLTGIPVEAHVGNWWLRKIIEGAAKDSQEDPLQPLLGIPLNAVEAVAATRFGDASSLQTTHRYVLTNGTTLQKSIASRFAARGFQRRQLGGTTVWWKGAENTQDYSFNRDDPFHFELGRPQRFAFAAGDLLLSPQFDEAKAALDCLAGNIKPDGEAVLLRELSEALDTFIASQKATILTAFAWSNQVYFDQRKTLGDLFSAQLSKTGKVDMEQLHKEALREMRKTNEPALPTPVIIAPIFTEAVHAAASTGNLERWSIMALLFPDAKSAQNAGPVLRARFNQLYQKTFKRKSPQFDVIVRDAGNAGRRALLLRMRAKLNTPSPLRLWREALNYREFTVLSLQ